MLDRNQNRDTFLNDHKLYRKLLKTWKFIRETKIHISLNYSVCHSVKTMQTQQHKIRFNTIITFQPQPTTNPQTNSTSTRKDF